MTAHEPDCAMTNMNGVVRLLQPQPPLTGRVLSGPGGRHPSYVVDADSLCLLCG